MRIPMAKEVFSRKISLLTSKLNIKLRKKLVRCYVWSNVLHGSETWKIGSKIFGELRNLVVDENAEKTKYSEKVTNEVLEVI